MNTLKPKLYTLVKAGIGDETLIYSDQNASRPPIPYWTMRVQSIATIGNYEVIQNKTNIDAQNIVGIRQATVQIQRIGEDSEISCLSFRALLNTTAIQDLWSTNKISCFDVSQVTNLATKLDNSVIEERAGMDLFVRFASDLLDESSGMFNTVSTNGEYETVDITAQFDANDDLTHTIIASSL